MKKIYVIRKYVLAESAEEAIRLSKRQKVDDCWVEDETHKKILNIQIEKSNKIGF